MALADAREGVERVRRIVSDLTTLSQPEEGAVENVEVFKILDSTLNVAANEIRHRARVQRIFSDVPLVRANGVRLGQLFLDLFLTAARPIAGGANSGMNTGSELYSSRMLSTFPLVTYSP